MTSSAATDSTGATKELCHSQYLKTPPFLQVLPPVRERCEDSSLPCLTAIFPGMVQTSQFPYPYLERLLFSRKILSTPLLRDYSLLAVEYREGCVKRM